jgi:hypothetical protein
MILTPPKKIMHYFSHFLQAMASQTPETPEEKVPSFSCVSRGVLNGYVCPQCHGWNHGVKQWSWGFGSGYCHLWCL